MFKSRPEQNIYLPKQIIDLQTLNFKTLGHYCSITKEKFFLVGGIWIAAMEGEPTERSYRNMAFEVEEYELPAYEEKLKALGVEIRPPRPRVDGEGASLYFYDFDHNLFELHSGSLEQRLRRYAR